MAHTWNSFISSLSDITRNNSEAKVCCTRCGNRYAYVKWGFYSRYLFNDELIKIQRYRCDNDLCPQKTFSILPHALLPIARASLCMLLYVLSMYEQGCCIADIAKHTCTDWPRIQRWIGKAISIRNWLRQEYSDNRPCFSPGTRWPAFIRDFIWAFYPNRIR
jgi:transposase-like protein